jgi:[ribosomal protein S18]-alanine N-acetyltransferase
MTAMPNTIAETWPWRPMQLQDIDAVVAMEREACLHPLHAWSADSYRSSLQSGYWALVMTDASGHMAGVCVAMAGVDEAHLLNIAVAASAQGQGLGRWMLSQLDAWCLQQQLPHIWLEVRPTNTPAQALYARLGYVLMGVRKGYYPGELGREDALVMKREVTHVAVD